MKSENSGDQAGPITIEGFWYTTCKCRGAIKLKCAYEPIVFIEVTRFFTILPNHPVYDNFSKTVQQTSSLNN